MRSVSWFRNALTVLTMASAPVVSATPPTQSTDVEMAPYGQYEQSPTYSNAGIVAVRFDPPFPAPYTITKIRFPSFTLNGVPAVFSSVRLCEFDPASGLVLWNVPLLSIAPYVGSANGWNEIAVDLTVTEPGKVLFVCVEFPAATSPTFPNGYPYLRSDSDMEKGLFAASFFLRPAQLHPEADLFHNTVVSLVCRLGEGEGAPLAAPTGLRANRIGRDIVFSFTPPSNVRLDGIRTSARAAARIDLLQSIRFNAGDRVWHVFASSDDPKSGSMSIPIFSPAMVNGDVWAVQAVEEDGRRSLLSNAVQFSTNDFLDGFVSYFEPNGSIEEAQGSMILGGWVNEASVNPAGDQDYYSLWAKPGQLIWATGGAERYYSLPPNYDLAIFLYDEHGHVVASADSSSHTGLTYRIPPSGTGRPDAAPKRFTLRMCDRRGSPLDPNAIPVRGLQTAYAFSAGIIDGPAPIAAMRRAAPGISARSDRNGLGGNELVLQFVLPEESESAPAVIKIYDVRGRLVRRLTEAGPASGARLARWDRKDATGHAMASGVYYVRLEAGEFQARTKVVLVR